MTIDEHSATDRWRERVATADGTGLSGELDADGGALLPPPFAPAEAREIRPRARSRGTASRCA